MTDQEALRRQIQSMLRKAGRSLASARLLLKDGDTDGASGKAYYAVFHALQAVLLTKSLSYSKHSGVLSGFSEHFVKPGLFASDLASRIRRLRRDREAGDYGYETSLSSEETTRDVNEAADILKILEAYLSQHLPK